MKRNYFTQLPKLSPRLQMIAQMVPVCDRLIDIGTDHAFIPMYIVAVGRCAGAVATDIRKGPADLARRNINKYCMEDRISVIVQDGLGQIDAGEKDCLVISGIGGYEIQSILMKKAPVNAGTIILQPQKSLRELRKFLSENGYSINEEEISKEKEHFYIAMNVSYTGIPYELSPLELEAGPCLTIRILTKTPDEKAANNLTHKSELYIEYMNHLIKRLQKQINGNPSLKEVLEKLEDEMSIGNLRK